MVEYRVLILTPTGADTQVAGQVLLEAAVASLGCASVDELCDRLDEGAGALVVAEEALTSKDAQALVARLNAQPTWSDVPLIVLTTSDSLRHSSELTDIFGSVGNMTLLERPFRVSIFVSTVRAALRARRKQYEVRQLVQSLRASNEAETIARQQIAESEAQFRQLADAMPQIVWVTRPDGYHEYFNRRWYDYIGVDFEASKGETQWADPLHVEDRERARLRWNHSLTTGEPYEIEYRFRRHDGVYRWFLARALPVRDESGTIERWYGTCTDIDDRRRYAEERQRLVSVIESCQDFIGIADLAGNATFVNDAGRKLVGLGSLEEARQTKVVDYFPPGERGLVETEVIPRVLHDGRWVGEMHFRHYRTGKLIPVLWDVFRVDDAAGKPISLATVTRDITDRKQIEAERETLLIGERAARSAAESASRMKDEFLATLSHELRTPLNAIVGWSQILKSSREEEELTEGLDVIARNARAQQQIIEDLLDMSRIISGKVRLDVQRIDLGSVIAASVDTVRHAAEAKGIRLQTVLDPRAGPVSGDPNRLQQVFWNLLTNAIKFTPKGGRIQVVLERINSHLEVSVIDSGDGINPEFLPRVFDRFSQADASTTRKHGGLGLGLAIVKQLVELHGGTIQVASPGEGHGSTFTVALPLTILHAELISQPERRHPTTVPQSPPGIDSCLKLRGVRVLVVDDEPDARRLLRRLLEDCEAVVITAATTSEGYEALVRERPDVLISDIGMPGEDGYSLIRKVRALATEQGGQTPALALTAYARSEDRTKAVLAGFQMHVSKPVEPVELIAMVASLAERNGD